MLTLTRRECVLDEKFSGKKSKEGDSRTLRLGLLDIPIDRQELGALLQEPHAYEALYNTGAKPIEPILKGLKALEFKSAWGGAYCVLYYSLGEKCIELKTAKLSRIRIELGGKGETTLAIIVEGEPPLNYKLAELIERTGQKIEVELRADHPDAQQDLPLNQHGEGEQPEDGKGPRRNGHRATH